MNTAPAGPFLVRTTKGSVLIQHLDQVREHLEREGDSVLEISSTVQKWKVNAQQARHFFQGGGASPTASEVLSHLATRTTEISSEIVRGTDRHGRTPSDRHGKPGNAPSAPPMKRRQEQSAQRRMDPRLRGTLIGSGIFLALCCVILYAFLRESPGVTVDKPLQPISDSPTTTRTEPGAGAEPPVRMPQTAPGEILARPVPAKSPESKPSQGDPVTAPPVPPPSPTPATTVSDLIAVNADHFGRRISWSARFKDDPEGGKPVIPCLMRVQNLSTESPFLWSSTILIYRIDRGNGLLLRLVEYLQGDRERRREFDYLSSPALLHGTRTFDLEFFASTDLSKGRVRLWMDDLPVTWNKLIIKDIANPQLNQERTISTAVISGDVPTLFTTKARWFAKGDSDGGIYSYTLTGNKEVSIDY